MSNLLLFFLSITELYSRVCSYICCCVLLVLLVNFCSLHSVYLYTPTPAFLNETATHTIVGIASEDAGSPCTIYRGLCQFLTQA